MRALAIAAVLGLFGLVACADAPVPRGAERTPDKAALYGDPGLVPTREGEQARREAAQAGEIRAAVELLAGVESARVDVESDDAGTRAVVVVRLHDEDAREDVRASTQRIVEAVLGPDDLETVIELGSPRVEAPLEPTPRTTWPIAIAVLGLGFSLGVTFDRARRLLRRRRRRG